MADGLYGVKQASKTKAKEFSSSTSLAFSSNLASLISSASTNSPSGTARSRATKRKDKDDIFKSHNKNVKKRAAADMLDDGEQRHQTETDLGVVESAQLARSKKRMEEKVKQYNAMKRGDYVTGGQGDSGNGLVDFDRKWADRQRSGGRDDDSDSSNDETSAGDNEIVEYIDEFGRLRKGTRAEAEKEERRMRVQENAAKEAEQFSARPTAPINIIYGDTVQHQAFNPGQIISDRMAELAKKRDRSATPPPPTHFDASAEVRTKGTGFYTFSHDSTERQEQMDALEKERSETERVRSEREKSKLQRKKDIEDRKKVIAQQRGKAMAEKFLNEFELPP